MIIFSAADDDRQLLVPNLSLTFNMENTLPGIWSATRSDPELGYSGIIYYIGLHAGLQDENRGF